MSSGSYGSIDFTAGIRETRPPRPGYLPVVGGSSWPQSARSNNSEPRSPLFHSLIQLVSASIFKISANASVLEKALSQIGTPKDSFKLRDNVHSTQQATNNEIALTAERLKQMSAAVRGGQRHSKLSLERLKSEFQDVVRKYGTLQKDYKQKIAEKMTAAIDISNQKVSSRHRMSTNAALYRNGYHDDDDDDDDDMEPFGGQVQQMQKANFEECIYFERENRIRQIESDILDVNEIFRDLATMVGEQGEVIDTIESNVETAYQNVESGEKQLVKASGYQKKYRRKICFLLLILAVVGGAIAIIVVLTNKKK